jgi:DNA mismatch repair protein MSH2
VTLKEEHALRSNSRYKIIDAVKGGVRFTNDKLGDLNADYSEAKAAYEDQQKTIIAEIFDVAGTYHPLEGRNLRDKFQPATVTV